MRIEALVVAILIVLTPVFATTAGHAADLLWEVESPYRFFKRTASFEVQEKAFNAVRGSPGQPLPTNILWKVERRLNDPDCRDSSTPDNCLATARAGFERSRLGWAAQPGRPQAARREGGPPPLHGRVRPAVFVGHREGGLYPPRGPHGRHADCTRAPRDCRRRRLRVDLAAQEGGPWGRDPQAGLQPQ